jgi:glycosyltransferase involved in cell wall biosynthesis
VERAYREAWSRWCRETAAPPAVHLHAGAKQETRRILVEGLRFGLNSQAVVNQFQCLELLKRTPGVEVFYRDVLRSNDWPRRGDLFDEGRARALEMIPPPPRNVEFDTVLRTGFPFDFSRSPLARRTYVMGSSETGVVPPITVRGAMPLGQAMRESDAIVVTPSEWSRKSFIASGADPSRVQVVPHGVDTEVFRPAADEAAHAALRHRLGWDGFVFLHVSSLLPNKGTWFLFKALAAVAERYPHVRLMLKGMDSIHGSRDRLATYTDALTAPERQRVMERLMYNGNDLPFEQMAELYRAADAYVSPYLANDFDLPVLEAAASGLPVICTAGGPTDEYTTDEFALRVAAQAQPSPQDPGSGAVVLVPDLDSLVQQMNAAVEREDFRAGARIAGPSFAGAGYRWRNSVDKLLGILLPGKRS